MTDKTDKTDTILRRGWSVFGKLVAGTRKGPSGDRVRLLKKLQKQFGLRFLDLSLLEQALTHRSYSHVTSRTRDASNERMEFLGDSVLGLSVSQFLYLQFPDRPEGSLSKMKSLLVSRKVLSEVSREIGLGEFLLLSGEESEMGGRDRDSILADSYEGVIGAIYLDQGYRAAGKFIQDTLLARINDILKDEGHTNYKSLLQEYVQSRRLSHPVYRVHAEDGPEHEKEFAVEVVVKGEVWGLGRGKNKKDAEQAAARAALDGQKRKTAAPAGAGRGAAPRPGKWRTSTMPTGERSGSEGGTPSTSGEDLRHGIRASREILRSTRETQTPELDRRNEERRQAERLERDARGGGAPPLERRGERGGDRSTERPGERRRSSERPVSVRREPEDRRPRREEAGREDLRRERPPVEAGGAIEPIRAGGVESDLRRVSEPEGAAIEGGLVPTGGRRRGRRGGRGRGRPSAPSGTVGTSPQVEVSESAPFPAPSAREEMPERIEEVRGEAPERSSLDSKAPSVPSVAVRPLPVFEPEERTLAGAGEQELDEAPMDEATVGGEGEGFAPRRRRRAPRGGKRR